MTSRRSFLRSLSLLPLAPSILSEAATAAVIPEPPHYYHYEKVDEKMAEFMKRYESAIMAGEYNTYGPREIVNAMADIIETNPSLIELPSDDKINKESYEGKEIMTFQRAAFIMGAKWMKNQILNQNK